MIVILGLSLFLLGLVTLTVILQACERRFPAFSAFLDRHAGQPGPWE